MIGGDSSHFETLFKEKIPESVSVFLRPSEKWCRQRYHPDKNGNDPVAADMFKEVTFSYNILSDPDKRHQYDAAGFEAVEADNQELELDLSSLGAVNTMFAALFGKLGVPIKTTVSATVLEEALNGAVTIRPLLLGQPISRKLLYFDLEETGGLSLALKVSAAKDSDAAFFKKLDGFQPCEITELKPGTHVFAVYEEKENLRAVEAEILSKRAELSKFETEYREVQAQFTEMTSRYTKEMQEIYELLKQRNEIHALYTNIPLIKRSSSRNKSKAASKEAKEDGEETGNILRGTERRRRNGSFPPIRMNKQRLTIALNLVDHCISLERSQQLSGSENSPRAPNFFLWRNIHAAK
ncbi:Chaperone protein dnaJ 16 [Hibiscus syriacus]|uniref:Chaperone protein dnaJ 16 n=1 Tax=Hibiscus syriacus TaxID=106335 RepID=A0A6A3B5M4_HIBSY|nr:Chaperone protein dnaJ 16 [Hibiscus syriacus]